MKCIPPPLVERLTEGSDYAVSLTWNAEAVLPALLDALGANGYLLGAAARYRHAVSADDKADALGVLARNFGVQESLVFRLAPADAERLEAAVAINAAEPDRCSRGDGNYALDLSGLCAECIDAEPIVARAV